MRGPETNGRILRLGYAALSLVLFLALGAFAWRGSYARYVTDDYCTASTLHKLGFLEAMKFHRATWSGRYSYYVVKALPESIGPGTARVVPSVMILLFLASSLWVIRRTFSPPHVPALMAAAGIVFAAIDLTPEVLAVGGPLVWETGAITYMLPLVLFTFWLGLFSGKGRVGTKCIASACLMLVAGGLSETSLAAQAAMTGGVLLVALVRRESAGVRIAATGVVATLVALLVVVSAPGNSARMSELPSQRPLISAILDSLHLAFDFLGSNIFIGGQALLIVLLLGALLGATSARVNVHTALLLAVAALGAFVASLVPAAWMLSTGPPPRALHVSNYFVIAAFLAVAAALGAARPRAVRAIAPIALFVAMVIPLYSAMKTVQTMPEARRSAAEIDRIAGIMRTHPGQDVVIHSPWAIAERILVSDPDFWTNKCICEYYGVRTLRVVR